MNLDTDRSSSLSKRSFAQVASATLNSLHHRSRCNNGAASSVRVSALFDCGDSERLSSSSSPFKRRSIRKSSSTTTMPIQTSPPSHPDSFPSFMSVFGGISSRFPERDDLAAPAAPSSAATLQPLRVPVHGSSASRRPLPFQHRESVSSMTSGSSDSSPTTTVSTFDSPTAPDTSPSSSPESPSSMPLYPKFMSAAHHVERQQQPTMLNQPSQPQQQQQQQQHQHQQEPKPSDTPNPMHPDSPGRRARNLKNLSLRMPPPLDSRPSISTASVVETTSQRHLSAPPSPVQIPPKSARRKPANLSIRTPQLDKSFSSNITEVVPPTPTARQPLRHTESSPSLHSVFSPSFGPKGGMQLPRPTTHHGARRSSEGGPSPLKTVADESSLARGSLHDLQEEDDRPDSRESSRRNERGYPNGPIRIYDAGVYLYLEPTAQEASQFDVVVNVAKEVANPFTNASPGSDTVMSAWRNASEQNGDQASIASQTDPSGRPEYIHVAWDHNSEILQDLQPLCELIDSRVTQGKKVLIHCQLGASRSASLVIAYGLYKNRDSDFNSMYERVKERSRWVGPNMSLIYQLTDFRSRLIRGTLSTPDEWSLAGTPKTETPAPILSATASLSASSNEASSQSPSTASLAPSTSPSTLPLSGSPGFSKTLSHKRSLPPRPLPLRQMYHTAEPADRPQRPRTSYAQPGSGTCPMLKNDVFVRDNKSADLSSIFSPRTIEFLAAPLSRPMAGALSNDGPSGFGFGSQIADPRSPPPGNERLIMRSIDEFL